MKRIITIALVLLLIGGAVAVSLSSQVFLSPHQGNYYENYKGFTDMIVGDWSERGKQFTTWQQSYVRKVTALAVVGIIVLFAIHMAAVGRKELPEGGREIPFYSLFNRFIHWVSALSVSLLALTGLAMTFGKYLGGGAFVRFLRYLHGVLGIFTVVPVSIMLLMWAKDSVFRGYDLTWIARFGGYLSKSHEPLPAGKFNAGQKIWFWLSTLVSIVMFYTGYLLFNFSATTDGLRTAALVHNILAILLLVALLGHLYMVLYIYRGALRSMLKGTKPERTVEFLYSEFYKRLKA
ncbi:MAG: formate dehydrogenase subunit gamma [Nitrospirae bacterium]|nr:MAG: formate dehydrogenase subunit gamma [Nitrospirota bacterium]